MMRRDFLKSVGAGMAAVCLAPRDAAAELLRRRRARSNLLDFTTYTKPDYRVWWHHRLLADALDRWERGRVKRLLVFLPPQVGKSEQVSRRLPAYMLGRNPDLKVLCCSHSATLAQSMNRDVQRIIDDQPYRCLFPEATIAQTGREYRRTLNYFEMVGARGSLLAAGVGMQIAGVPADRGIIDDPFGGDEDAQSVTIRDKVWEWYCNDFSNRLSKDAPILITHTRWNRDDLAGRLLLRMAEKTADQWEILCLPSLRTETLTHPDDPRQVGEALWPDHKSVTDLQALRDQNPRGFAAIHQQNPRGAGAEWPQEWFGPEIWFDEWPPADTGHKVIFLDSSKGKGGKTGDFSAFVKVQSHDGVLWIDADMRNDRNAEGLADAVLTLQAGWHPHVFGCEEEFGGPVLKELVRQMAAQRSILMPDLWLVGTGGVNKDVRIRRLTQWLGSHKMRFKSGSRGAKLLVQQLEEFPHGDHDDGPDALEGAMRLFVAGGVL